MFISNLWFIQMNHSIYEGLLLLLNHFSHVQLCVTPSLGFSRQEHWSGLSFPSPMHESEKWKWSRSAMSDSSGPHGLQPTRLLHPWDFPGKSTGVGFHCLLCYEGQSYSIILECSSRWQIHSFRISVYFSDTWWLYKIQR